MRDQNKLQFALYNVVRFECKCAVNRADCSQKKFHAFYGVVTVTKNLRGAGRSQIYRPRKALGRAIQTYTFAHFA